MRINLLVQASTCARALTTLLLTSLLICFSGESSFAQQDRQLTQNGSASTTTVSKRIALVIGNGAYTSAPPLKNPPNDARDMAASLRTLGFDVTSGINVNQKDMKRLIREFGLKLKGGGSGLFYYAGHGVQSKGRNYLIPIDAEIQSEAEVEDSGVDASLVLNYMDDAQNGLNIVILDACRNNPFARSFRSASDGLAQVDAPTGTLIAYATAPGRVASDGAGQNGLYSSELLKQMQVPGISITDMFMRVRGEVMKQTGSKQVPWEASSLVGSFYFSSAPGEATAATNPSRIDPTAFELSYWETIKNSQSADDFKAYLARYPQGQFVELAKNRITALTVPARPVDSQPADPNNSATELAFWDVIKNSTSADDFRAYLKKFPNGTFADLANNRLRAFEKDEETKRKADEIARQTKSFKGVYVTLVVSPGKVEFQHKDGSRTQLECSLSKAKLEKSLIKNMCLDRQCVFFAESAAQAAKAWEAIQEACKSPSQLTPPDQGGSLQGTTWKGDSSGGDKHYEFQFLANGEVVWNLQWNGKKNYKGTWHQNGNTITMDFRPWWTEPVLITINGNQMNGSWANGQYKFSLMKVQ